MAKVEIYTWQFCPFCIKAKGLLNKKGINFLEHKIDGNPEERSKMTIRSNGRNTLPQIFINGEGIGGCDDLHELDESNQLDILLASEE